MILFSFWLTTVEPATVFFGFIEKFALYQELSVKTLSLAGGFISCVSSGKKMAQHQENIL